MILNLEKYRYGTDDSVRWGKFFGLFTQSHIFFSSTNHGPAGGLQNCYSESFASKIHLPNKARKFRVAPLVFSQVWYTIFLYLVLCQ